MENLLEDKEIYYSMYNKKLVDKAFEYLKDSRSFNNAKVGAMLALEDKACQNMTYEERGARFNRLNLSTFMFAYLHGALENIGLTREDIEPDKEKKYSDFRKNRDFCIYYDFGDNDFGEYVEKAANIYADKYNYYLRELDYRLKDDEDGKINIENLYTYQDLVKLEEFENIYKILGKGVVGSAILSDAEYHFIGNNSQPSVKDSVENNYKYFDYLGINNRDKYIIGTYEEVEKQVIERHKHNNRNIENLSLKNIWINGEALVIAVEDGEMKCWIK